jgi:hypothetical protein
MSRASQIKREGRGRDETQAWECGTWTRTGDERTGRGTLQMMRLP